MQTFRFFENTGGMNLRANDLALGSQEAEEIINLHPTSRGSWSSDNVGYETLNDGPVAGEGTITSLYEYVTLAGQRYLMATANTRLFTFEPSTGAFTEVVDGLSNGARMNFVTFQGLLIGCNGSDSPKKWEGTGALTDLGGWPPVIAGITPGNPSIAATFANRLVFSGDSSNPSMLYISELENPENFTPGIGAATAGAIQVSPGDGDSIVAIQTMYLPIESEEILVIFKERSTYILTGNDADTFVLQKISDEFGAVSHRSVIQIGSEMMFLSREGITSLSTATAQGNLTTGFLSQRISPQVATLNPGKLSESFAVHLRQRQEIWWFVADGSSLQNQTVLVYNYGTVQAWSKRSGIIAACGVVQNGQLYTGNYDGEIQHQLRGNSYNGEPIPWLYRTPFYDFSKPRQRKRIKDIELYLKQISNISLTVKMAWDFQRGANRQERTLTLTPDSSSSLYGTAVYGVSVFGLSGTSVLKFIPNGSGRMFQLEFSGDVADKPVEIEGWTITALSGGFR